MRQKKHSLHEVNFTCYSQLNNVCCHVIKCSLDCKCIPPLWNPNHGTLRVKLNTQHYDRGCISQLSHMNENTTNMSFFTCNVYLSSRTTEDNMTCDMSDFMKSYSKAGHDTNPFYT